MERGFLCHFNGHLVVDGKLSCGCLACQSLRGLVWGRLACRCREEEENINLGGLAYSREDKPACRPVWRWANAPWEKGLAGLQAVWGKPCESRPDGPFCCWALVRAGGGLKIGLNWIQNRPKMGLIFGPWAHHKNEIKNKMG